VVVVVVVVVGLTSPYSFLLHLTAGWWLEVTVKRRARENRFQMALKRINRELQDLGE